MNERRWILAALAGGSLLFVSGSPTRQGAGTRIAISHALPQLDGNKLKVTVVEVHYAPGQASNAHSHPCPVIGYVVSGSIKSQVRGEAETVYKAGETFYEPPNGVHAVSANASDKDPATLLAYFVCDSDAPLSGPPRP